MSVFENSLNSMMSERGQLHFVQVGANDGLHNDPINAFIKKQTEATKVTLIEPNPTVVPYLKENYRFHPNHEIIEKAVGPAGELTLYVVDPAAWPLLKLDYGKDWPAYRAPTGVTSSNKEHVRNWLEEYLNSSTDVDTAISEISVECLPLSRMLDKFSQVDVLVIDAEGADGQIILDNVNSEFLPSLIFFECVHLEKEHLESVLSFLEGLGYSSEREKQNIIATFPVTEPGTFIQRLMSGIKRMANLN